MTRANNFLNCTRYRAKRLGVSMDSSWATYEGFLATMGPHPGENYCLKRIDTEGPFNCENCVWARKNWKSASSHSRGVRKKGEKWESYLCEDNRFICLGYFDNREDAYRAHITEKIARLTRDCSPPHAYGGE